eukprot:7484800-Karenia_brevis.AAC.1
MSSLRLTDGLLGPYSSPSTPPNFQLQSVRQAANLYIALNVGGILGTWSETPWDMRNMWLDAAIATPLPALTYLYRSMSMKVHPDKNRHELATKAFQKVHPCIGNL